MASIFISVVAVIISIYSIYLSHLKKPDLIFYTDEKVGIFSERHSTGNGIKLKLNIYNAGASVGEITDLILKIDDKYILCPSSREAKLPINVENNKYAVEEIKFNPILENKKDFSAKKLKNEEKHEYLLYARLNGQEEWKKVLKREFINKRTVLFKECRDRIINDSIKK